MRVFLSCYLIRECALYFFEASDVFYFDAGVACFCYADVRVCFYCSCVGVVHVEVVEDSDEFFHEFACFFWRVHVGFCDYFYERDAGSVVVNKCCGGCGNVAVVDECGRVFFDVDAFESHDFAVVEGDAAARAEGLFVLGDLVVFCEVGVKVCFS